MNLELVLVLVRGASGVSRHGYRMGIESVFAVCAGAGWAGLVGVWCGVWAGREWAICKTLRTWTTLVKDLVGVGAVLKPL